MMGTLTRSDLADLTVDHLQELIQLNIDSHDGLRDALEQIHDPSLRELFQKISADRANQAVELQEIVARDGRSPKHQGTYLAAFQRAWMQLRAALSGDNLHAILSETARSEEHIQAAYENALKEIADMNIRRVLTLQFEQILVANDRIRVMRDATS